MTNAFNIVPSAPMAGLGTFSTTVTTAGLYTLAFKSFLPYQAAGSPAVTSQPSAASADITLVADSSGSLNNTWFKFYSAGNAYGYYVWYNINSAGTDPAIAGLTGIEVDGATNANATTLATATRAAINASTAVSYVTVGGATTHVTLANKQLGSNTGAADGTAATGFTFTDTAGSDGVPAASGLVVQLKKNSTLLATYSFPSPTQPVMGGSTVVSCSANDTLSVVLSSQSTADAALNAVKTIINCYAGE